MKRLREAFAAFWAVLRGRQAVHVYGDNVLLQSCVIRGGVALGGDYVSVIGCNISADGADYGILADGRSEVTKTIEEE